MGNDDDNIEYNDIYSYVDYLDKLNVNEKDLCKENIRRLLNSTGHISKVTNIATGVGYCIYKAKLQEFIGVRDFIVSNTPGKGTDIHKLLGLVSIEIFNGHTPKLDKTLIRKIYDENIELFVDRDDKDENIELAYEMLNSLRNVLVYRIYNKLETSYDKLFPVVEQQFHDYEYHILGVPDLILEDKEKKRAIVVEWKTYDEQVYDTEKAQVIAYSLLEAKRLGYSGRNAVDAITGVWDDNQKTIRDVKILPLIIRPGIGKGKKLTLQPHPILFSNTKEKFIEFRKLIDKVIVVAGYLTLQLVNPKVFGIDEKEVRDYCKLKIGDKEYSALRLIPIGLRKGNPSRRNKFPCKSGNSPICPLFDACGFYLGQYKKTPFDIVMWALRYYTIGSKESTSIIFKVIYELFTTHRRENVISNLKNGNGYEWRFAESLPAQSKKSQRIIIYKDKKIFQQIRLDIIDGILDPDNFVIYREVRDYEKKDRKLRVIREGKPIMLFLNDGSRIPSLSLNLTARIDKVEVDNDLVKYYINIPSSVFRYSLALIKKYIKKYPELVKDSLIVETGVDLTSRELMTIDAIQRKLRDDSQKIMEKIRKGVNNGKEEAEKIFKKVADELEKESNNGWDLYQTIDDILPKLISKLNKAGD